MPLHKTLTQIEKKNKTKSTPKAYATTVGFQEVME